MRVLLSFHPAAWEDPAARWTVDVVGRLLEVAWEAGVAGAPRSAAVSAGERDLIVHVGPTGSAPPDADLHLAWEKARPWPVEEVVLAEFDSVPLLAPRGADLAPPDTRTISAAVLRSAFHVLSREEERATAQRDEWECFAAPMSRQHALGVLETPIVHGLAGLVERRLRAAAALRGGMLPELPRWPAGRRFACMLSHDVDELRYYSVREALRLLLLARQPRSYAARAGLGALARSLPRVGRGDDPYWNLELWTRAEEAYGFRSAFYLCASTPAERHEYDATYHMTDPLRLDGKTTTVGSAFAALAARGFELGLHGSYRSHRDAAVLAAQRRLVERATGTPLVGTRQHYLRLDVPATWRAQEGAGFAYDTTLGYNEGLGFRAGIAAPFHPWDAERTRPLDLLELPLTLMDGVLFRTWKLDAAPASERVRTHLDAVERAGGLAVLLWHPNSGAEPLYPGWWPAYGAALAHLAERGAWVATGREIVAWHAERSEAQRFLDG